MEPFVCRSDAGLGQDNGIRDNAALPVLQRRGGSGGPGSAEPGDAEPRPGADSAASPRGSAAPAPREHRGPPRGGLGALGLCPGRGPCPRGVPGGGSPSPRCVPGRGSVPARGSIPARPSPAKGGSGRRDKPETPVPAGLALGIFPGSPFLRQEASGKAQVSVRSWGNREGAVI